MYSLARFLSFIVEHFKIIARVFGLVTWLAPYSGCWFKRDHTDIRHLILKSIRVHSDLALTVDLVARILRHTLPSDDGLELRHNCAICIPEAELRLWEPYSYRCGLSIIRQTSPSDAHKSAELNKVYHIMLIVEISVSFSLSLYFKLLLLLFFHRSFFLLEQILAHWDCAVDWWFVCTVRDLLYPSRRWVDRCLPGNAVGAVGGLAHVYLRFPRNSR